MKRDLIFKQVQNSLTEIIDISGFKILDDQLITTFFIDDDICKIKIRCQTFGKVFLMNLPVNMIKIEALESEFESLLFDNLKKYYNNDFTLSVGSKSLDLNLPFSEFRIESEKDSIEYCEKLTGHVRNLKEVFFYPMTNVRNLAQYIGRFEYENNLKVLVGGKFPVQTFKKIFLLHKGNQRERYFEYKEGIQKQIESFSIRKPQRKDEAKIFMDNCINLLNELEKGNTLLS